MEENSAKRKKEGLTNPKKRSILVSRMKEGDKEKRQAQAGPGELEEGKKRGLTNPKKRSIIRNIKTEGNVTE